MLIIEHVETNVTLACQNTCVGCNHFAPIQTAQPITVERLAHDLSALGKVARVNRWAAIGGEPTLHPQIAELLKAARESGTVDIIEVWTNGYALPRMNELFWQYVNEIDLTIYPNKAVDIDWIAAKCKECGIVLNIKHAEGDFTQLAYQRTASVDEATGMYNGCWYRTYCRVLDGGIFYRCCTSPFIPDLLLGMPKGTDGIEVDGLTEQGLMDYLNQTKTPQSCYRCAGHAGKHIGWREASRKEWLDESMR